MMLAIAAFLTACVCCDVAWRTRLNVSQRTADVAVSDGKEIAVDLLPGRSLATFTPHHPAVQSYLSDPADLTRRRVSDPSSTREWLNDPAHREMSSSAVCGHYQLSLVTSLDAAATGEGWILLRHLRDFSDSDVEKASRLLPTLIALDRLMLERCGHGAAAVGVTSDLSSREHQVLALMAEGLTANAIGRRLGIAPGTVRKHLERVYRKLGHHDRLAAVTYARRAGLLPEA